MMLDDPPPDVAAPTRSADTSLPRRCWHCRAVLVDVPTRGRPQRYCDRSCRDAAYYKRRLGSDDHNMTRVLGELVDLRQRLDAAVEVSWHFWRKVNRLKDDNDRLRALLAELGHPQPPPPTQGDDA